MRLTQCASTTNNARECSECVKARAGRSQQLVSYVNKVLVREHPQVAAIKTVLWLKGHPTGITRKPLRLLPEDETKTVYEDLRAMDLLQRNTFILYTASSSLDKKL